jgi:hypothetical protein
VKPAAPIKSEYQRSRSTRPAARSGERFRSLGGIIHWLPVAFALLLFASIASGQEPVHPLKPPVRPNVATLATAFNQQYGKQGALSIRASHAFHDRFLVVDDSEFYHFGASLKDLGARGFMFSKIEESSVVALLRKSINDDWTKAAIVA